MIPNNLQKKLDSTLSTLALLVIASTVISIGALTILIDLMWAVVIGLALCAGYYRLRAQAINLNHLAYRLRLSIYKML
jgi:hypothetical protein